MNDIHCAACTGTDYIGRPCRGRTNFHTEYDAARALADELAAALRGLDDNDGIDTFTDEGVLAFVKARATLAKWEASHAK